MDDLLATLSSALVTGALRRDPAKRQSWPGSRSPAVCRGDPLAPLCADRARGGRLMTAWHRLLRRALRRQGGFFPELETWISGLAAVERARSYDAGSAGAVIAELDAQVSYLSYRHFVYRAATLGCRGSPPSTSCLLSHHALSNVPAVALIVDPPRPLGLRASP